MFEGLKARLGVGGRRRRYVDIESVHDLEDISDPETSEDDSRRGVVEFVFEHPLIGFLAGLTTLFVGGFLILQLAQFAPGVIHNVWVQRAVAALIIAAVAYRYGWRNHKEYVTSYDELELKIGNTAVAYKGVFLDDLPGEAPGFIPIKGWSTAGHRPRPYLNADLGAAMVESYNPYQMRDDAAAVIRLQRRDGKELAVTDTDWGGKRVVQESSGLRPDPHGQYTSLVATLPEYDDARANELAAQLEELQKDNNDLRGEIQGYVRRVANLKDRLNEPIEDEVEKRMKQIRRFNETRDGRRRDASLGPRPTGDYRGNGSIQGSNGESRDEVSQVEEELTDDD